MYSDLIICKATYPFGILEYSVLCFFRYMLAYEIIFSVIKVYSHILRLIQNPVKHCQTYSYSDLLRHIQHPVWQSHIHNLVIFWALEYLEPGAYLKPCERLTRHIQNPAIGIIQPYSKPCATFHMQKPGILGILENS